jgi:ComEC/Rec2-related protein
VEKFSLTEIPAFKLFFLILSGTIGLFFTNLSSTESMYLIIGCTLLGFIAIYFKLKFVSYILIIIAISSILSFRIIQDKIPFQDNFTPPISGVFQGEINQIVAKGDNWVNFIADGSFDNKFTGVISDCRFYIRYAFVDSLMIQRMLPSAKISVNLKASLPQKKQLDNEFDQRAYALANDIDWFGEVRGNNLAQIGFESKFKVYSYQIRKGAQDRIDSLFEANTSAVVTALLTGEKSKLSPELRDVFSQSGTAHLLAVSGLHVGIISVIAWFLLAFIKNLPIKIVLFLILIWAFILFTGFPPSGIRAGIFASLYVIIKSSQKQVNSLNVLGLTGLLILLFDPKAIFSASFQMSFASVFGILVFYTAFRNAMMNLFKISENPFSRFIINSLALSLSASLVVSPIVAYYFGIYSIVSPLANLIAVPLITLSLVYSLIGVCVSYLFFDLGQIFCNAAQFLIGLTEQTNRMAVSYDFAYLISDYVVLQSAIVSLLIAYVLIAQNNKKLISRFIVSSIFFVAFLNLLPVRASDTDKIVLREDFVAYIKDVADEGRYVFVCDRRPRIYPRNDYYLNNYLNDYEGMIYIAYTGNCGINIADFLKEQRSIKEFEIDREMLNLLNDICDVDNNFIKRVRYDDRN